MARVFKNPDGSYIKGKGVVCAYGEDPLTGRKLEHKIRFVANDENFVFNMLAAIRELAAITYVLPGLVKLTYLQTGVVARGKSFAVLRLSSTLITVTTPQ